MAVETLAEAGDGDFDRQREASEGIIALEGMLRAEFAGHPERPAPGEMVLVPGPNPGAITMRRAHVELRLSTPKANYFTSPDFRGPS